MSGVKSVAVAPEEAEIRLDRWFRRHYPALAHGRLEKLLRTGQIRVDGKRAQAGLRLAAGQQIRVPPQALAEKSAPENRRVVQQPSRRDAEFVRSLVIHRDEAVIAINKPAGLAVQGGTGTTRHLDAMLDALRFGAKERPRLVHRLDRDTSGVLLLARSAAVAARLGKAFRGRDVRKIYWALVVGAPAVEEGRIDLALGKRPGRHGEQMVPDPSEGKPATTLYRVVETAGSAAAWLALWPLTGRTHQLRVHCAAMGHPIVGDGKYGGAAAFLPGEAVSRALHLHARELRLQNPAGSGELHLVAPLPPHMAESWAMFGFDPDWPGDPFDALV